METIILSCLVVVIVLLLQDKIAIKKKPKQISIQEKVNLNQSDIMEQEQTKNDCLSNNAIKHPIQETEIKSENLTTECAEIENGCFQFPRKDLENPKEKEERNRYRMDLSKKVNYKETFLINRFPSARKGKVVYIRPEYHERLLRIVQLTMDERTTLYSYIDNILEHHFREYGDDITNYFNERFKPIL